MKDVDVRNQSMTTMNVLPVAPVGGDDAPAARPRRGTKRAVLLIAVLAAAITAVYLSPVRAWLSDAGGVRRAGQALGLGVYPVGVGTIAPIVGGGGRAPGGAVTGAVDLPRRDRDDRAARRVRGAAAAAVHRGGDDAGILARAAAGGVGNRGRVLRRVPVHPLGRARVGAAPVAEAPEVGGSRAGAGNPRGDPIATD